MPLTLRNNGTTAHTVEIHESIFSAPFDFVSNPVPPGGMVQSTQTLKVGSYMMTANLNRAYTLPFDAV